MSDQRPNPWFEENPAAFANAFTEEVKEHPLPFFTASQMEAAITTMLRNLEIAIVINRHGESYHWEVLEGGGRAQNFLKALEQALSHLEKQYLTEVVPK